MDLNLLILRTKDIEELKSFYSNLLNVNFEEHLDHGPRHYGAKVGNTYLEIYQTRKEQRQLDGLGFSLSSLEFKANVSEEFILERSENNIKLKDPDGRLVFLERKD